MEAMGGLAVNIVMEGINAALEKRDWKRRESENESRAGDSRFDAGGFPDRRE